VIVTTDENIQYQQNLKTRKIALVVLEHSQWPMVKVVAENILAGRQRGATRQLRGSRGAVQGISRNFRRTPRLQEIRVEESGP
jgi:hypothetical protein